MMFLSLWCCHYELRSCLFPAERSLYFVWARFCDGAVGCAVVVDANANVQLVFVF